MSSAFLDILAGLNSIKQTELKQSPNSSQQNAIVDNKWLRCIRVENDEAETLLNWSPVCIEYLYQ